MNGVWLYLFLVVLALPVKEVRAYTHVYINTALYRDGSVYREFDQHEEVTREASQRPERWDYVLVEGERIIAGGQFDAVSQIPRHFEKFAIPVHGATKEVGLEFPGSTLERDLAVTDHIFLTEYRWEETLTDIVKLQDVPNALEDTKQFFSHRHKSWLGAVLAPQHDPQPFMEWVETQFLEVYEKQMYTLLEAGLLKDSHWYDSGEFQDRLKAMEAPLGNRGSIGFFGDFPASILVPLGEDEFIRRFIPEENAQSVKERFEDGPDDDWLAKNYGSEEQFWAEVSRLAIRLFGVYFGAVSEFQFEVEMPVDVVETNGVLLPDNRVLWRFQGAAAYPLGYRMYARAMIPNLDRQHALLGDASIETPADMRVFVDALSGHAGVQWWLNESVKRGRLLPAASYGLGQAYQSLRLERAVQWYCRAAAENHSKAASQMAKLYESRVFPSIEPDLRAAYVWYALAARVWLGASIHNLSRGLEVTGVFENSPAMAGGIRTGDIILAFDDQPVTEATELQAMVGTMAAGTRVRVDVSRNDEVVTLYVTLSEQPDPGRAAALKALSPEQLAKAQRMFEMWSPDKCPWPG